MKLKTKRRLQFYLSLVILILITLGVGIVFEYVVFVAWQMRLGLRVVPYETFMLMAIILIIMTVTDIILFFHLILRRQFW